MVALKAVVIALGALILGTIVVIAVVLFNRTADGTAEDASTAPFHVTLDIGPGCEVVETRVDRERLMVRTGGPGACRRIYLMDLEAGTAIGTVELAPVP